MHDVTWYDFDTTRPPFGPLLWLAVETINGLDVKLGCQDNAGWHCVESATPYEIDSDKIRAWAHLGDRPDVPSRQIVWA